MIYNMTFVISVMKRQTMLGRPLKRDLPKLGTKPKNSAAMPGKPPKKVHPKPEMRFPTPQTMPGRPLKRDLPKPGTKPKKSAAMPGKLPKKEPLKSAMLFPIPQTKPLHRQTPRPTIPKPETVPPNRKTAHTKRGGGFSLTLKIKKAVEESQQPF